jgi:hypothetical protein
MPGITQFPYGFDRRAELVDSQGLLLRDGRDLIQALMNRTGGPSGGPNVVVGIAAVGNSQATAQLLTGDWNYVETVPSGTGVIIPIMGSAGSLAPSVGTDIIVFNADANPLNVYPPNVKVASGPVQIDALAPNAPYVLAVGKMQWFRQVKPTLLKSMQLG